MPGAFTAFRRTDGAPLWDVYDWVTDHGWMTDAETADPYEVEEVVMVPVTVRTFRVGVHEFEPCDDDPDECDRCSGPRESEFHAPREAS
jgi:hypothetical protein